PPVARYTEIGEPGLTADAPPRTVDRSTSVSCPLSERTTIQLPAITLTVPCNSAQRGRSAAGSDSLPVVGVAFSSAGEAGADGSTGAGAPAVGGLGGRSGAVGGRRTAGVVGMARGVGAARAVRTARRG